MAKTKVSSANPLKTVMGPLWPVFSNPKCWEIIIDSHEGVYSISNSKFTHEKVLKTGKDLDALISRILKFSKKKIAEGDLSCYVRLDAHTSVNIVLPPLAMNGPSLVINKYPEKKVTLDDLVEWQALDHEGKKLIEKILSSNKGFLVAGNMGSGKTTLLNTLVDSIPSLNRVVTLERVPDLVLNRPLLTRLQSQTQKATEMIDLIGLAERMRADYVVLSECVGPEIGAFVEMVRSNSVGVALATAENVVDAVKRMVTKTVLSSDGFSLEEANYALAQTFSYIIFQEKRADGKRMVSSISETYYENGEMKLKVLYKR